MAQELTIEEPQAVASATGPQKICKFFFIGRGNPIHDGHEYAMVEMLKMVKESRENGCDARGLILLGSGPNGGERTMDNPITFELKADIIRRKLEAQKFTEGEDYIIKKMENPARDVSNFVNDGLTGNPKELNIEVGHIAGKKGPDIGKLNFIDKSVSNSLPEHKKYEYKTSGLSPKKSASGKDMSATEVRKDAYLAYLNGEPEVWKEKYRWFYGDLTDQVYDEILFPLKNIEEKTKKAVIKEYIDSGELPKTKKARKGGSTRNKRNKTNKRSNLKKRRTQRKKRRTTRRR
jgi:nicotinamide mononucleotide adenylyltransferase